MRNKKGLTIIEVVVAMFVLTVGLVSVIELIGRSIATANKARDAAIAVGLAQEGIEIVRNFRDQNLADGCDHPFSASNVGACKMIFKKNAGINKRHCFADKDDPDLTNCSKGANKKELKMEVGFYMHNNSPTTYKFQRKTFFYFYDNNNPANEINDPDNAAKIEAFVIVAWGKPDNAFLDAIETETDLTDDCNIIDNCIYVREVLTAHD